MDPTKSDIDISDTYDSRTAEIFSVILMSLSLGLEFVDEDSILKDYDKGNMKSHVINGKAYLCSDFTAMMLERTMDIEKSILKEHSVMDLNELKDAVHERLMEGGHLMGTKNEDEIERIMSLYFS
jgi:predicted RNA-binding protein associated with RNAse of E/G family